MTKGARTVRIREWHDHEITALDPTNIGPDGFYDADGFVAHGPTARNRFKLLVRPEITSADTGTSDADDCIRGLHESGIGHLLNPDVARLVHDGGSHAL